MILMIMKRITLYGDFPASCLSYLKVLSWYSSRQAEENNRNFSGLLVLTPPFEPAVSRYKPIAL
jgi:hypothetical protein